MMTVTATADDDETTNCSPASDPLNAASTPVDTDSDGSCDTLDTDDDNDSILDGADSFAVGCDAVPGPRWR